MERGRFYQQFGERSGSGEAGVPRSGEQSAKPEIHYDGTPTVTVRLVNGVQQDVPHLYVDSRGGQTRWWVERESIESWQERVRAAKERGDERYRDISPDTIPSSITHNYPDIPPSVLQKHPAYANREWVTLAYSLSPNQDGERDEHTFLNTAASPEEETTIYSRSVKVDRWREIPQLETGGEQSAGEGRETFSQQFGEQRGEAGSQEPQASEGVPQDQSWYEQEIPYEQLVAALKHFREKESARWETPIHQFPTAEWLADELDTQAERSANSGAPREEQTFFNELKIAWHAVAYPQFGRSLSGIARKEIEEYIQATGSKSVTLRPKAVKLFDAMAEVAEIPRKRGEATVDLTSFVKLSTT